MMELVEAVSFRRLLRSVIGLEFSEDNAFMYYHKILDHQDMLISQLGRTVTLRVAALDYFTAIEPFLKKPKIIEEDDYNQIVIKNSLDHLTGAFERRYLPQKIALEIKISKGFPSFFSIVFIDIDNFSSINNQYGHSIGDSVLQHIVSIMLECMRQKDTIYRYGGEEFVVLMPQTGRKEAYDCVERLRKKISSEPIKIDGDLIITATISGGIACYPDDAKRGKTLLRKADSAMYRAKKSGKNKIEVHI
ncbi:GGDEF domain-containing protein [Chlamydiota bacterium]